MIHLEKLAKDVVLHPCSDMEIVRTTRYLFIGVAAMFTQDEYISSSQIPQLLNQMADFIKQGKVTEYVRINNGQVPAVSEFMFNKVLSRSNIVNMLYFSYGVGLPCRITHTVCGSPPCMKNKSH